jgi:diguanylate cyclase (GGDEF)-like protein
MGWLRLGLACTTLAAQNPAQTLPTLTTIGAIHRLTAPEAARGYPVRVRAIVTYYDAIPKHPQHPTLVVTDDTATIFVTTPAIPFPIKAGSVLEITGKSAPGEFAPVIVQPRLRFLGQGAPPARAARATLSQFLKGADDPAWVEMEGVVEGVERAGDNVTLKLGLADGEMAATTVSEQGVNYAGLVDALVSIRGVAGSIFNRHGQLSGYQLFFPSMAAVTVEQAAPRDPFELPIRGIGSLMTYAPGKIFNHRTHIRGAATLFWPGRLLCVHDASGSLCAITSQTAPLATGEMVDVAGFAGIGQIAPILSDAVYRALPTRAEVAPIAIDGQEGLSGENDAKLVQIEGKLITQDRALKDFTILVSAGRFTFPVSLPRTPESRSLLKVEEGSLVRVTGICAVQTDSTAFFHDDGHAKIKFFQIFLRSPADVAVLRRPSWWTAAHSLRVLELAFAATLCILGWSLYLRRRLKQQTELLRYQATHDGLTGTWNRKAICDLLERESEIASRVHKQVGVIMLDADYFKRVNDTLGHPAGDAVLMELAKRIQLSVRSYDLTGRYGGEEFLIVLPECTDEQVQSCAERVRAKVAERPFDAEGSRLAITVSLGTTVPDPLIDTQQEALAAADRALYRAKLLGRNRVVSATTESPRCGEAQGPSCETTTNVSTAL